ncbi:MAG: hypothetical protein AAB649_07885 [Patescibacteria group bacterium]
MSTITIQKEQVEKQAGVVILPIGEYQKLVKRALPTYYLTGKEAKKLDKLVNEGLRAYKSGKTKKIRSLADLD